MHLYKINVAPAARGGDVQPLGLGDLHCQVPNPPGCALDEQPRVGGQAAMHNHLTAVRSLTGVDGVVSHLVGGEPSDAQRGGLLEGACCGCTHEAQHGHGDVLGKCAAARRVADDAVAGAPGSSGLDHLARKVKAEDFGVDGDCALGDLVVQRIDRCCVSRYWRRMVCSSSVPALMRTNACLSSTQRGLS